MPDKPLTDVKTIRSRARKNLALREQDAWLSAALDCGRLSRPLSAPTRH